MFLLSSYGLWRFMYSDAMMILIFVIGGLPFGWRTGRGRAAILPACRGRCHRRGSRSQASYPWICYWLRLSWRLIPSRSNPCSFSWCHLPTPWMDRQGAAGCWRDSPGWMISHRGWARCLRLSTSYPSISSANKWFKLYIGSLFINEGRLEKSEI
jgi:hypothetical protein